MPDKEWNRLWECDQRIRRMVGFGDPDNEGTLLIIKYIAGFEMFNTRPYHNYETWGSGYRIEFPGISTKWADGQDLYVQAEDLDDAITAAEALLARVHAHPELPGDVIIREWSYDRYMLELEAENSNTEPES